MSDVFFLHGFASSPAGTKATFLAERLAAHGVTLHAPDFNLPDFASLTMTRMLGQLEDAMTAAGDGPATLIGSSLGGTLAVLTAARLGPRVDRLVLMAPAVMFARPGHQLLPPERIEEWRRRGSMPFVHHGHQGQNVERPLNFAFFEDTLRHDAFDVQFSQPTLVFQGRHDRAVDPAAVEAFARARPNVALSLLDDDHQLLASLPYMWAKIEPFLGLAE